VPRRPDHRDPTRTTGPNPRLPQDARAARDRRATHLPQDPRAARAPQPPRPPRRPPGRLSIRRGEPGRRLGIALLAIAIVLTLFAGRLVQIQGMESAHYRMAALKEKLTSIALPAMRGSIYGSNGQILAMTIETFTYTADPTQISAADKPVFAQQLAGPLGMTSASILNLLRHPTSPKYVVLAKGVSAADEARIDALGLVGIYENSVYSRAYPDGEATANVVGFTNVNQDSGVLAGQAGIEEEYNQRLTGTAGSEQVEIGADGQPIPLAGSEDTPARNGESIRLTIDPDLQFSAMQACEQEVKKAKAKQCTAVIIAPKTGDILAMAQWPTYDQNTLTNVADDTNLDVQDIFTPGSTAKVITASAALEHGGKTLMSSYNIPSEIYRGGQWIHDAEWSPGEHYTIAGIIANSSNVGMSQVVQSVSPQLQYEYLRNFGLDEPTGLGLPDESEGLLQPPSQWAADERYTLAYGQGIAVNAVQMASVYATIANDGVRVQPRLIAGTYNAAGQYTQAAASKSTRVIKAKTAKELISVLQQVPAVDQEADQPWGIIPGYAVAAKTGTANEPGPSCPGADPLCVYGASYIGMAPGNGPQVVVAINVQNPDKADQDYFGDMVAGPVFYSVMKDALANLQIQPQPGLEPPYVRLNAR
jgi:cell division protein FtsI (penicillin-binding protein 3)